MTSHLVRNNQSTTPLSMDSPLARKLSWTNSSSLLVSVYSSQSLRARRNKASGKLNLSLVSYASNTPPMNSSVKPGCARSAWKSPELITIKQGDSVGNKPLWMHVSRFELLPDSCHPPQAIHIFELNCTIGRTYFECKLWGSYLLEDWL